MLSFNRLNGFRKSPYIKSNVCLSLCLFVPLCKLYFSIKENKPHFEKNLHVNNLKGLLSLEIINQRVMGNFLQDWRSKAVQHRHQMRL